MEEFMAPSEFSGPQPRLIPHVVSSIAKNDPLRIWGSIARDPVDVSKGYEDITFARLNSAVTRAARWLQQAIDHQRRMDFEALAYLGPPDPRYIIFNIAAIKAGYQMLYLSPRNSDEAQRTVIQQAQSEKFLCASSYETRVKKILNSHPCLSTMSCLVVPELEELLDHKVEPDFPYERTLEEARSLPLVILHTSSTTGMPKIVRLNQGYGLHEDILQHVPKFNGLDIITRKPFYGDCRMFVAMPLFHAGGILITLLKSLYHGIVAVFQPPFAPLDAQLFDGILRYGNCNGCVIPPYLLEEMLAVPSYFDTLAGLDFVQFGSGPLSKAAGDLLLTRQPNCPHYIGSSECGLYLLLELDDPVEDWQYFRFHPWSGVDLRPVGGDDKTRELFVVRHNGAKIPGLQPAFELFPDLQEWATKDLFVQHPSKLDHWKYIGRSDDILVLSNGEKLNPVDIEGRISNTHPSVTGALVVGQGQFAPGLLLELRDFDSSDEAARAKLIDAIWPAIQEANRTSPGHGQLSKSLILFSSKEKPFLRTPKLSIRRGPTIALYSEEISLMYERYTETVDNEQPQAAIDVSSSETVRKFLSEIILEITGWEEQLSPDEDLFMYGMDSLQVSRIVRGIRSKLSQQSHTLRLDPAIIYRHPTLRSLADIVYTQLAGGAIDAQSTREQRIEKLTETYAKFESLSNLQSTPLAETSPLNVVLTGSTGSLGTCILMELFDNPKVASICCLNRSGNAMDRQIAAMTDASRVEDLKRRVHFLHSASLGEPHLGLDDASWECLRNCKPTHIIHNAWPVNFNLSLQSFESHLAGVHSLVDFSVGLAIHPRIIFVSSLSSVTTLSSKTKVPEKMILDPSAPAPMGYGESKYIAEHILNEASKASSGAVGSTVLRVGQIAGPVKSTSTVWPTREWFPSLVISSKTVGALPESLGRMSNLDWIPVDLLASSINELLAEDKLTPGSDIFHVVNPQVTTWARAAPGVAAKAGINKFLPLKDWIELIANGPDESSTSRPNPAKKILPFYQSLQLDETEGVELGSPRFAVGNMAAVSATFRNLEPIGQDDMSRWVAMWV